MNSSSDLKHSEHRAVPVLPHAEVNVHPKSWKSPAIPRQSSAPVPRSKLSLGITHDGSMVLLYMVYHGSHQYTPFMLAYIPYMDPMGNYAKIWRFHGI